MIGHKSVSIDAKPNFCVTEMTFTHHSLYGFFALGFKGTWDEIPLSHQPGHCIATVEIPYPL